MKILIKDLWIRDITENQWKKGFSYVEEEIFEAERQFIWKDPFYDKLCTNCGPALRQYSRKIGHQHISIFFEIGIFIRCVLL